MQTLIRPSILICAFALLIACEGPGTDTQQAAESAEPAAAPPPAAATVTNTDLQARIEAGSAPLVLDVRTPEEFADGHITGALNIAHDEIAARVAELPADRGTEIVVHCRSGKRAATAEATLAELGFTNVRHLEGDYLGWQAAGLPVE